MCSNNNNTIQNRFGAVIADLRRSKELSQQDLAVKVGLHRTYISQIERGIKSPSLRIIQNISFFFEMKISELFQIIENE